MAKKISKKEVKKIITEFFTLLHCSKEEKDHFFAILKDEEWAQFQVMMADEDERAAFLEKIKIAKEKEAKKALAAKKRIKKAIKTGEEIIL